MAELQATRWTGRPGYRVRAMVGMALAKHRYTLPTWTRTVALVREHACYRFAAKLHQVVGAEFGLPLAWRVETAKAQESSFVVPLLDAVRARGFRPGSR